MLIKKLLSLTLFTLFSFTALAEQTPKISQAELLALLDQPDTSSFIVLDVRTPKEYNSGHIKGAINIGHNAITENLSLIENHKDKTVIVHCHSGRRAISAEKALKTNGFSNVRHLEGDMMGWIAAKLPVTLQIP